MSVVDYFDSMISYLNFCRGDFRSDSGRRRHASSGTRPVSSVDYPDLYHLLGLTKPGDGQVNLLLPFRRCSHFFLYCYCSQIF